MSCCPWIFIRNSPIFFKTETDVNLPFILATLPPSALISLVIVSSPSSHSIPFSNKLSIAFWDKSVNKAVIIALEAPVLTISLVTLCPNIAFIPFISIDLPAPVSPVKTLKFEAKGIDAFWITAKFSI